MRFNSLTTERTTAASDVALGIVCLAVIGGLLPLRGHDPWKVALWMGLLALLAAAAFFGGIVHGST